MEPKKSPSFGLIIIAFIIGTGIFKQFNFEKREFKNTALAIIYIITFLGCAYFIIKDFRKK